MQYKKLALLLALNAVACAPDKPAESAGENAVFEPGVFSFNPEVGASFKHVMTRLEQVEIIGSPLQRSEKWRTTWQVSIAQEVDLFVYQATLEALEIHIDGKALLKGAEVTGQGGKMELLFDKKGHMVDIRHTETLTEVLSAVVPPDKREAVGQFFSPQNLKLLFLHRANERSRDLLGRPASEGVIWKGDLVEQGSGHVIKELRVTGTENCGKSKCVNVVRTLSPSPDLVWAAARSKVKEYVIAQGGDAQSVELTNAEVQLKDTFLVDPHRMQFHHAEFDQQATLSVATAQGDLSVKFTTHRESLYEY